MKHLIRLPILSLLFFLFFGLTNSYAQVSWVGTGDGLNWSDANNWNPAAVPVVGDDVLINNGDIVQVNFTGAVAKSILIDNSSTLNIVSGSLAIENGNSSDGIIIENTSTLSIASGAALMITNTYDDGIDGDDNSTIAIGSGATVTLSNIGDDGIKIEANSTVTIGSGATVTITMTDEDAFEIENSGTITIANGANLTLSDIGEDAFFVDSGTGTITNSGNITLDDIGTSSAGGSVILVSSASNIKFTNEATGTIKNTRVIDEDFVHVSSSANDNSTIINRGLIELSKINDIGFHLSSNMTFDNFGTINLDSLFDHGIEINTGVVVTNHSSGVFNFLDVEDNTIDVNGNSSFTNNGNIIINQSQGGANNSQGGLDIDGPDGKITNNGNITINGTEDAESVMVAGTFTNNGVLNIGVGTTGDEALVVDPNASLTNTSCGIINITTQDIIDNKGGVINNQGIITTVFTGANTNTGSFTNGGIISAPASNFRISGNPLINTGAGKINGAPIPATIALCNIPIPTFSQWSLAIFILLLLNLGIFLIYQKKEILG